MLIFLVISRYLEDSTFWNNSFYNSKNKRLLQVDFDSYRMYNI